MVYHYLKLGLPLRDEEFDKMYPTVERDISKKYWTPIDVAIKAAKFLIKDKGTKVLDIGSGIGKFCFVGSAVTEGKFIGVEQRDDYVKIAKGSVKIFNVENVHFIKANIKEIDFSAYDSFYFFNPFYQYLNQQEGIPYTPDLYYEYSNYVKRQFEGLPLGTRIVTYHGSNEEIPLTFDLLSSDCNGYLKFWIKNHEKEEHGLLEEQFIKNGISRIKKLGFSGVNKCTIFNDDVYKTLFEHILRSQYGRGELVNKIVLNLLGKIHKS